MRRIYSVIAAFLLLMSLWGCATQHSNEIHNTTPSSIPIDTTVPITTVQPQIRQQPMIAASLPIIEEKHTSEDGQVLLQNIYQNLELIVPDQDVADAIIIDFLNRTDKGQSSAESLYNEALNAYKSGNFQEPYLSQITFAPTRLDQSVFSLLGHTVLHKGHSHPEVTAESVTYDMTTGKALTISDILQPGKDAVTLCNQILTALKSKEDTITFYNGYQDIVSDLLAHSTNWYFSETGLVFYYSPYEIAPYSSGVITAEIPYENLTDCLDDAYFPAESDVAGGQLIVAPLQLENTDQFTQIAELVCNAGGEQVVLHTDGLLEDIRIEQIRNNDECMVFASPHITPGDGIVIYLSPSEQFRIYYSVNGKRTTKTLCITSDGAPQLND